MRLRSLEFKAVLPKIEAHCIFVALVGELHRLVRVVVHHRSEILYGGWPLPLAVQGDNCLGLLVVDGLAEIRHSKFCAGPASLFVRNTFCEAPVGFPLTPRELTEVVHFKASLAAARKVLVVVNLRKDQDTTPFEVCAVGQRPTRKGIESRCFEERELELLLLGECAVAKLHQTVLLAFDFLHIETAPRRSRGPPLSLATNSCGRQKRRRRQTRRTCPTHGPAPALSHQRGWGVSALTTGRRGPRVAGQRARGRPRRYRVGDPGAAARARRERQVDGDSGTSRIGNSPRRR